MAHILAPIALLAQALLFGGMIFFAAVVAPLVFRKLPPDQSGPFIRAVFPVYYLYVFITAALAALTIGERPQALVLLGVALVTLWLRQVLTPGINRLSDRAQKGDVAAQKRFGRAHRVSVLINLVQMLAAGGILVHLAR